MLKRLGLEQLLGLGFGLVLVIVTVAGLVAIRGQITLRNISMQALQDSQSANLAQHLAMLQQREQATSRAYFLEPENHGDRRCAEAARDFAATLEKIQNGPAQDDASRDLLEKTRSSWQAGETELQKMFELGRSGQKDAMLGELPTSVHISKELQDAIAKYVSHVEDLAHQRELEQKKISSEVLWMTSTLIGLGFLIAIVCCVVTIRIVSRRVEQAKVALDAIANMDLSRKEIEVFTYDALGHALRSVNQMQRTLVSVVAELGEIGSHVAGAAAELTASAENSAGGADEQSSRAEQLATTLTEMSSSVAEIARHSAVTSQSAGEANAAVREGEEAVELTNAKMSQITEQSVVVTRSIEDLVKISDDIGRAANLIRDIADQTNLLALNAAIEAARAGENGKGFSVVASEVRKLAVQTGTATNEIESMIQTVQSQAKTALEQTREEHAHIAEGVTLTQTTRDSFTNIRKSVSTVDSMMEQIAAAAQEQAAATEDLNQNLNGIVQLIARSANAAHEASVACGELSKLSDQMHGRVAEFLLPDEDVQKGVHFSGDRSVSRLHSAA